MAQLTNTELEMKCRPRREDKDDDCFYIVLFSALEQIQCSDVILHEWLAFYSPFLNIHRSGVLTALAWLVPHETAAVLAQVLCTPYNHAPCHFMQSHIRKVYAYSICAKTEEGLRKRERNRHRWTTRRDRHRDTKIDRRDKFSIPTCVRYIQVSKAYIMPNNNDNKPTQTGYPKRKKKKKESSILR